VVELQETFLSTMLMSESSSSGRAAPKRPKRLLVFVTHTRCSSGFSVHKCQNISHHIIFMLQNTHTHITHDRLTFTAAAVGSSGHSRWHIPMSNTSRAVNFLPFYDSFARDREHLFTPIARASRAHNFGFHRDRNFFLSFHKKEQEENLKFSLGVWLMSLVQTPQHSSSSSKQEKNLLPHDETRN
jgi:hypothetical protein